MSLVATSRLVTPRRYDLAVKWRFFRHLASGSDHESERLYRWHIEKRSGHRMKAGLATDAWKRAAGDYVTAARVLFQSMSAHGFFNVYSIPADVNGELFGGAHRVACAMALEIDAIPVHQVQGVVWAPPWGLEWFTANGMEQFDLERLKRDMQEISGAQAQCTTPQLMTSGLSSGS